MYIHAGIGDLRIVLKEISSVSEWEALGLELGLFHNTIENINRERRGKTTACKIDMMAAWLKQTDQVHELGGPTWQQLASALREVSECPLAEGLEERYLRKRSHDEDTDQSFSKRRH